VVATLPNIAGIPIISKTFIYHYSVICAVLDNPNNVARQYPSSLRWQRTQCGFYCECIKRQIVLTAVC